MFIPYPCGLIIQVISPPIFFQIIIKAITGIYLLAYLPIKMYKCTYSSYYQRTSFFTYNIYNNKIKPGALLSTKPKQKKKWNVNYMFGC